MIANLFSSKSAHHRSKIENDDIVHLSIVDGTIKALKTHIPDPLEYEKFIKICFSDRSSTHKNYNIKYPHA